MPRRTTRNLTAAEREERELMDWSFRLMAEEVWPTPCRDCGDAFEKCAHNHAGVKGRCCCECFGKKYANDQYAAWRREWRKAKGLNPSL